MLGAIGGDVKHMVGVAVVGGNQSKTALGENCRNHLGKSVVNSLDSLDSSLKDTGVAHHVAVSEVHDVEISAVLVNGSDELFGNPEALISGLRS